MPPGPGGIGNHAHQLTLNLQRLGWEMMVVSPQEYASAEEIGKFNSAQRFRIIRVPSSRGRLREALHRLGVAYRVAREHKPDVLMGTGRSGVWVTAALGTIGSLPWAAVAHGSEFGMSKGALGTVNRWAFQRATAIIAVSRFTRGVVQEAGIRPRRMEIIPNAADGTRFTILPESERQAFRQKAGFNGFPLLLTVGHVSERKGQEVVIRALPHILRKLPDTHYAMIGLPTLKERLTQLAKQLGVRDRVLFLGPVTNNDMVRWHNCADVFVMTSRTTQDGDCEGFGIAVVEAALCGKPAVVSAQSGLIEAIQDGVTGIAVPEGDANATAEAVISLLTNRERRRAMGEAAYTRALREQTWETCARRYDALLRDIVRDAQ